MRGWEVTKPEQPQTLRVIAHYKGDSRVVDANHDVFDYVMLRSLQRIIKVTPPLKGRVDVELLAFIFQILLPRHPLKRQRESRPVLA